MLRTPFYPHHISLGGKMVDFAGWEMPVQYTSITEEHTAVRTAAGLFDISHMGQVFVWGPGAAAYLQNLVTNDIVGTPPGKGVYAHMLNDAGGVIDDLYVYRLEEDKFLVIINASRRDADLHWMRARSEEFEVTILEAPDGAALALQGPNAVRIMESLSPVAVELSRNHIAEATVGDLSILAARTGYTGEDGFELFAPAGHLLLLWDELFAAGRPHGLLACGLGARDTLRTEAAYPLYGHELDEKRTPLEAGLSWVVKMKKGPFIGRAALEEQISRGIPSQLCGFKVESGGVARPGGIVLLDGKEVGIVTSGTFSPTLRHSIGLVYLPAGRAAEGVRLTIRQGTREFTATTVKTPFYKRP